MQLLLNLTNSSGTAVTYGTNPSVTVPANDSAQVIVDTDAPAVVSEINALSIAVTITTADLPSILGAVSTGTNTDITVDSALVGKL